MNYTKTKTLTLALLLWATAAASQTSTMDVRIALEDFFSSLALLNDPETEYSVHHFVEDYESPMHIFHYNGDDTGMAEWCRRYRERVLGRNTVTHQVSDVRIAGSDFGTLSIEAKVIRTVNDQKTVIPLQAIIIIGKDGMKMLSLNMTDDRMGRVTERSFGIGRIYPDDAPAHWPIEIAACYHTYGMAGVKLLVSVPGTLLWIGGQIALSGGVFQEAQGSSPDFLGRDDRKLEATENTWSAINGYDITMTTTPSWLSDTPIDPYGKGQNIHSRILLMPMCGISLNGWVHAEAGIGACRTRDMYEVPERYMVRDYSYKPVEAGLPQIADEQTFTAYGHGTWTYSVHPKWKPALQASLITTVPLSRKMDFSLGTGILVLPADTSLEFSIGVVLK